MVAPLMVSVVFAGLSLEGDWHCPTREAVERTLQERGALTKEGHHLRWLYVSGEALAEVRLTDDTGMVLASRMLPADSDCKRMARVLAVLVTSWESEPSPLSPVIPFPPPPMPAGSLIRGLEPRERPDEQPAPAPISRSPAPATPFPSNEAPRKLPSTRVKAATGSKSTRRSDKHEQRWRFGLAGTGGLADGGLAAGGLAFLAFEPLNGWGAHVKAFGELQRTFALGPGTLSWERIGLSIGQSYSFDLHPLQVGIEGDVAFALLDVRARGFTSNRASQVFDPGVSFGIVADLPGWVAEPWLGVWGIAWPLPEHAQVEATTLSRLIPQLELLASLGISFRLP